MDFETTRLVITTVVAVISGVAGGLTIWSHISRMRDQRLVDCRTEIAELKRRLTDKDVTIGDLEAENRRQARLIIRLSGDDDEAPPRRRKAPSA